MSMPTNIYAIGDIQGCLTELEQLLTVIEFNPATDQLWFTGDLVNRGKRSLETLQFIKSLGDSAITILGNHDLFLINAYFGNRQPEAEDTIQEILLANDCDQLIAWLLQQPLVHHQYGYTMVHAGIPPQWSVAQALNYSKEVEQVLQTEAEKFTPHMYGNEPCQWSDDLTGYDRLRYIINAFTRMRYCSADGELDLSFKGNPENYHGNAQPWFTLPNRKTKDDKILFGHWASLQGKTDTQNTFALDTGCVWGEKLCAMRLQDQKYFYTQC